MADDSRSDSGKGVPDGQSALSIFAVVVIYRMRPEESATVKTLAAAANMAGPILRLYTLIYDNTPGGQQVGVLADGVRYVAAPHNPGLAEAYNAAIVAAGEQGYDWLLTLDQDTNLPSDFFVVLQRLVPRYAANKRVAAIVPYIVDGGKAVSPFRFVGGFLPRVLPPGYSGLAGPFASAINSASLLRVATMRQIGGYDERFPLNNSDTSLFFRLGRAGLRIAVVGELIVKHELAILNRRERMTVQRYRQLLADERAFWDLEMSLPARMERLLRLMGRAGKDAFHRGNRVFQKVTLAEIAYRLTTRRKARIAAWKRGFGDR